MVDGRSFFSSSSLVIDIILGTKEYMSGQIQITVRGETAAQPGSIRTAKKKKKKNQSEKQEKETIQEKTGREGELRVKGFERDRCPGIFEH